MDLHQVSKYSDDLTTLFAEKHFVDHLALQCSSASDTNNSPIELTNATGTNLNEHVNDDCLREIFSVNSLSLMDLCAISKTCKRFRRISETLYPTSLCIEVYNSGSYKVWSRSYLSRNDLGTDDMGRIFKKFGSFLSSIEISSPLRSSEKHSTFLLNLVTVHCADNSKLKSIEIRGLNLPAHLTIKLKPIFKRLQQFQIEGGSIVDDMTLFEDLDSLVELEVVCVSNSRAILANIFPELEHFAYRCFDDEKAIERILPTFLSRHTHLQTLYLLDFYGLQNKYKKMILQAISNRCKALEKLEINLGCTQDSSFLPLQALKSLTVLKILNCDNFNDLKFFSYLTQLTELELQTDRLFMANLVDIIRRLTKLEKFTFRSKYGIGLNEKTFTQIIDIVKGRPNVLTLECYSEFNWKNYDANQSVRLKKLLY